MKKCILIIIIGTFAFSCTDEFPDYVAYNNFDEYKLTPIIEINSTKLPDNYILFKKNNKIIDIVVMPIKRKVSYEKRNWFWYSIEKGAIEIGTSASTDKETFVLNDTIYKLETNYSKSREIEWQGLIMKTKNREFYFSIDTIIDESIIDNKINKVILLSKKSKNFEIILKEEHQDTLFSFKTNNDNLNLVKDCIFSVEVLDNLNDFGKNFYSANDITSWFIEKKPDLSKCK